MPHLEIASKVAHVEPSLSELPYVIPSHRRVLFIYRTGTERTSAMLRAALTGIEQGEAVIPFADERFLSLLRQAADATGRRDQLHPVAHADPSRGNAPDQLILLVRDALRRTAEGGYLRSRLIVDTQLAYTLAGTEEEFLGFAGMLTSLADTEQISLVQICFYEFLPRHALADFLGMHSDIVLSPALAGMLPESEYAASPVGLISAMRALYLSKAGVLRRVLDPVITRGEGSAPFPLPSVTDYLREDFVLLDSDRTVRYTSIGGGPDGRARSLNDVLSQSDYPRVRSALEALESSPDDEVQLTLAGDGSGDSQVLRIHRLSADGDLVGFLCIFQRLAAGKQSAVRTDRRSNGENQITEREHEIIRLLLSGMRNRQIADKLDVAEITVKKHLGSIYRKLHVRNRIELIRLWERG